MTNVASSDAVESRQIADHLRHNREMDDVRWVLSTPAGRRFIMSCLEQAGIYRNGFDTDPLVMAANCAARNQGLWLIDQLGKADPAAYIGMLQERLATIQELRLQLEQEPAQADN